VPLFLSLELAERIERAEAGLMARAAEGGLVMPLAGGIATCAGPGSPFTKLAGLGFAGVPGDAELEEVERAFAALDAPLQVELAHVADPAVAELLTARGYRLVGFENVLGRDIGDDRPPAGAPDIAVGPVAEDQLDAWLDVVADGVAHPDAEGVPAHEDFPRDVVIEAERGLLAAGARPYAAWRGGALAGGGSMCIDGGIAQLTGAATVPAHRRRGVQTALLAARLADAAAAGCDVAVVTTQPASKSQENVQRRGFELLYTRAVLRAP
jgi:GNAT superfamily N-acetyltransferase